MNFKLWTRRSPNSTTFSAYRIYPLCDNPKKGTTPAKGEEAEVVVCQPRGVGLIHTRLEPSGAHYTLASGRQRKY